MRPFNPLEPGVVADPYPVYAEYREHEPVHWGTPGDPATPGTWYLFRHSDVLSALKDPRLGREVWRVKPEAVPKTAPEFQPLQDMMDDWMFLRDPPVHTRLRALVNKAFVPRMVDRLLPDVAADAEQLLDAVAEQDRVDLIADYARILPVTAIAAALGVPPQDYRLFLPWSVALAAMIEFRTTDDTRRAGLRAMHALQAYLRQLIGERRRQPREDLISGLIHAEEEGRKLSEDEMLATIVLLLTAGNDPTMHMIGNAVLTLLRHPDHLAWLRAHPEALERANDELLRYDSSVQMTFRYALQDVTIGGHHVRAGDHIAIVFGSALRDPAYCAEPDALVLTRENNRLPFGFGPHFCLGMPLARPLGQIAIEAVLRRWPDLHLDDQPITWQETVAVRGVRALPTRTRKHT